MTATEVAAWYAAFIATVVLAWDVYKWKRTGPRITGTAYAGWRAIGYPEMEGRDLIYVNIANAGDQPTTLGQWGMVWKPPRKLLWGKKKVESFLAKGGPGDLGRVPKRLEPGDTWQGVGTQTKELDKLLSSGRFYIWLQFSHKSKPVLIRITNQDPKNAEGKKP